MDTKVRTRGNVIVNEIKIGDTHYEYDYNMCIKSEVVTLPERDEDGYWSWQSRHDTTGNIIDYGVSEDMAHYSSKLYDYEAYKGYKMI